MHKDKVMKIIFIRHGKTVGNLEGRYIGTTDESLCEKGIAGIKAMNYPDVQQVVCSPLKRCTETAEMIYPRVIPIVCDDLRECDFGDFENKNYLELSGNPDYQRWVDSNGKLPFPNGESHVQFKARCISAFDRQLVNSRNKDTAFVVHGGTIMAILEKYAVPKGSFYDFQVKNGCGFITEFDGKSLIITGKIGEEK